MKTTGMARCLHERNAIALTESVFWVYYPYMDPRTPHEALKSVFGYDQFRPLQEDIVRCVLNKQDTLAVMPTGGGKSLCYQIPALLFPGLTVVVSPLIALMKDQVDQLTNAGVEAIVLNSSLDKEEWVANVRKLRSGSVKLLYVAPETLVTDRTQELLSDIRVDCITVDEAHCISDWGHDFRPEYRKIAGIRERFPGAVCLALTATATSGVRKDIRKNLKLHNPAEFTASFNRSNIYLEVAPKSNPVAQVLDFLSKNQNASGIIYCFSRKQVESVADELVSRGYPALAYHAGLNDETRARNQQKFVADEALIMVATVAFGMGINKPNVDFVIHFDLPKSLEQYYQEIGRAGRDGRPARALLLYGRGDTRKIRFFMEEKSAAENRKAEILLKAMTNYAESRTCRRAALLSWFGENFENSTEEVREPGLFDAGTTGSNTGVPAPAGSDGRNGGLPCCDVCDKGPVPEVDMTIPSQKFLSCVARTGNRYGAAYLIEILLGSRAKRILENGHNKLSVWGIGRELEKDGWFQLSNLLLEEGYLSKDDEYGVLSLTSLAKEALAERFEIMLPFFAAGEPDKISPLRKKGARMSQAGLESSDKAGQTILALMKDLRRSLADAASVPPYVVFPDRTLEDIAVKKPVVRSQLQGIYGIGEVKAEKYGDFILQTVRKSLDR